ncbi:DUF4386 domain-containing protein [Nocardioides sp. NPDC006273]|uniref:DUF4386 domain-containing protein n=1 Tax=Nocardioides sp. NPDC006273 TaxID=3155598 RepID=UPI0033BF0775
MTTADQQPPTTIRHSIRSAIHPSRRLTTTAGVLVFAGMVAGLLSVVPVLEQDDYFGALPARSAEVVSGALFQVLMIPAYAGFALALYPSLRRVSAGLAAGFLGFRLMACGFHLLAAAMLPLLLDLAQGHGTAAPDAATYEILAETLRKARDLVNHVAVIVALGLGDLLLFTLLHRWRLVPRWLSLWGLCGAGLAIFASLLVLSRAVEIVAAPYLLLNAPLALQSLILGAWLIGRGLRESSPIARSRGTGH